MVGEGECKNAMVAPVVLGFRGAGERDAGSARGMDTGGMREGAGCKHEILAIASRHTGVVLTFLPGRVRII